MAQQHGIYVYNQNAVDFTTTGLVGDLRPIEATFTEEKNGESQIVLKLTYDKHEKWKAVRVGQLIKCEVPVRIPPVIKDDEYANTVKIGTSST